ncbi:tyrosine-protein kinase receptor TYRO3 isoform X2 [Engraulis encrasicolus]|uniref:tyrosine-protein kinase receptor TYRO3 isoform X2 n=1 Tax=Engraulis encrasicolus TaxID=184585 RepID=UPI002FD6B4E5
MALILRMSVVWNIYVPCVTWIFFHKVFAQSAVEEELFNSIEKAELKWTSIPKKAWKENTFRLGSNSYHPVYQACVEGNARRLVTTSISRGDGRVILLDIKFAQEIQQGDGPLMISVREPRRQPRLFSSLKAPVGFPRDFNLTVVEAHLHSAQGVNIPRVSSDTFQLEFSYSGPCVFIAAVRVYFKLCPAFQGNLTEFGAVPAGSGLQIGRCAGGSVEVTPPRRECAEDGSWGPLQGTCVCLPGYQDARGSCEGPPSEPVNLTYRPLNDSTLSLHWDPPNDLGGRQEVTYAVECRQKASEPTSSATPWALCGNITRVLPQSHHLTGTAANVTGLQPHLDYRLGVKASNDLGSSSYTTTTIHKWKVPVINPTTTTSNNTNRQSLQVESMERGSPSLQLLVGVLGGVVLLVVLVPAVFVLLRKKYKRLMPFPEEPLLPTHPVVTFRRHGTQSDPTPSRAPLQALAGVSERLLSGLREVLVDRERLTLGKELGKGEFGSVYEAVFTQKEGIQMKVAVKTMRAGIHSQEDLETFLKEAEIMRDFDHENVVNLLGVSLEQDGESSIPVPLVILPFLKHGDLRRFLIATRYGDIPMFVPCQSLLHFMVDIAAGMEYLSSKGFLHRDLAARNCMLGDDLHVRVADFGLSKSVYSGNYYRQKVAIRLPMKWMAMESLAESMFTTKTDVWSFGVTMWEIMSRGRTPYPGVHNHELLAYLEAGRRLSPPAECDSKLYEVMLSCWESDPVRRPGFAELGLRLKGLLSELPHLEANKEAHYINMGLEAAAAAASSQGGASGVHPELEGEEEEEEGGTNTLGNIYLPGPGVGVRSSIAPQEMVEREEEEGGLERDEEGYLLFVKCGTTGTSDGHKSEHFA